MHEHRTKHRSNGRGPARSARTTVIEWRDAVRAAPLDRTAKLVALVLSTYFGARRLTAWPARARLARDCGLSVRSVEQAVRRIEAAGLLKVVRSTGGRRSNLYAACMPEANELRRSSLPAANRTGSGGADRVRRGDARSPEAGEAGEERGDAAGRVGRGVPLDECVSCGEIRPLPDELHCDACLAETGEGV